MLITLEGMAVGELIGKRITDIHRMDAITRQSRQCSLHNGEHGGSLCPLS